MPKVLLLVKGQGNRRALGAALGQHGYTVDGVTDDVELTTCLEAAPLPDAALVDISGYRDEIWSMCARLQKSNVPFLVISGQAQRSQCEQGLELGAASVLEKPLVKSSLLKLLAGLTR